MPVRYFFLCFAMLCLAWFSYFVPPSEGVALPAELLAQMEAGDMIFRIGDGWQSGAVRGLERWARRKDDPYSHVGMLVGTPARWQVLHAVPAERPDRPDAVVLDDLEFFLAPERSQGVAIYRVTAPAPARIFAVEAALKRLDTPFKIVENDTQGQYCTTLIWHVWRSAGIDLGARFEWLKVPLSAGGWYLLPHDLRAASNLRLLFEVRTKSPA